MNWAKRLRDMLLAGGAVAAAACNGSTASPADASPSDAPPNPGPESGGCCNASPDPCCYLACSGGLGPDAAVTVACEQNRMDCEAMHGFYETQVDGSLGCTPLGGPEPGDASPTDAEAGASDADASPADSDAGDAGGDAHD